MLLAARHGPRMALCVPLQSWRQIISLSLNLNLNLNLNIELTPLCVSVTRCSISSPRDS
jgi:hypothetical protein